MGVKTEITKKPLVRRQLAIIGMSVAVGGLAFYVLGFLLLPKVPTKTSVQKQPNNAHRFTAAEKDIYAKGTLLVKFKAGINVSEVITRITKEPQKQYVDKKTGQKVTEITPEVLKDTEKYQQKDTPITVESTKAIFSSPQLTKAVKDKITRRGVKELDKKLGAKNLTQWQVVSVNSDIDVPDLVQRFISDAQVETAEPSYINSAQLAERLPIEELIDEGDASGGPLVPNDTFYSSTGTWGQSYRDMWGLQRISVPQAWDVTTGKNEIVVAVSDTGIDYTHPDLQGRIWQNTGEIAGNGIDDDGNGFIDDVQGWDFRNDDNDPIDDNGHGTYVAGVIGATTNNLEGTAGINWNVRLMPVKGLGRYGTAWPEVLARTIVYAADNGADVINMSWGGSNAKVKSDALAYANSLGVILVAATGNNNGPVSDFSPASDPHAIAVAAWGPNTANDPAGYRPTFSNYGDKIDVTAPGVDVLSLRATGTDMDCQDNTIYCGTAIVPLCDDRSSELTHCPSNRYYRDSGTSIAAPHVSGVMALMLAVHDPLDPELARIILRQSAEDVLTPGKDIYSGYGLVNAGNTLSLLSQAKSELVVADSSAQNVGANKVKVESTIANISFSAASNIHYEIFSGDPTLARVVTSGTIPSIAANSNEKAGITYSLTDFPSNTLTTRVYLEDPGLEFITTNNDFSINIPPPSPLTGWPVSTGANSTPTIADIDSDGANEIIISSSSQNIVTVLRGDGSLQPGWPVSTLGSVYGVPLVIDLNSDGQNEIMVNTAGWNAGQSRIYVWDATGHTLPGWPVDVEEPNHGSLAVADLNGDNSPEVVTKGVYGIISIYRADGSEVTQGWPKNIRGTSGANYSSPILADLDNDGIKEIIASTNERIQVFRFDGSSLNGWPLTINQYESYSVVADLNNDGRQELIVASSDYKVHCFDYKGSEIPNWPQATGGYVHGLALADLDSDGSIEVIEGGDDKTVNIWRADGTALAGWPRQVGNSIKTSPTVADIDGDGKPEVFVASSGGALDAWYFDGRLLFDWPNVIAGGASSPSIGDINEDGRPEIVAVGTSSGMAYAWDILEAAPGDPLPWPMLNHDNQRTGLFVVPALVVTEPRYGSSVNGTITLRAQSRIEGLWQIEYYYDNNMLIGRTGISPSDLRWDTRSLAIGPHVIYAKLVNIRSNTPIAVSPKVKIIKVKGRILIPDEPGLNPN